MNIELKRFTTSTRLSQETTAFAADVWVDGAKAGHAENDGHGGATIVHLDPAVRAKVEAHGKALVPDEYKSLTGGAEWIVDQLVEATLQRKAEAALSKKISKNDTNARVVLAKEGLRAARFRAGDTWCWFAFKPLEDPKAIAIALVAKQAGVLDELVVLS